MARIADGSHAHIHGALSIDVTIQRIDTAVGLAKDLILMIIAVVIAMIIMLVFSGRISSFIKKHPSLEILALSFLILIGFMLIVEALHHEVPKGYIYFAVFFSLSVEFINIRIRTRRRVVRLNKRIEDRDENTEIPVSPVSRIEE